MPTHCRDAVADFVAAFGQIAGHASEVNETLVNRIDFLLGTKTSGQTHHAVAQISVEGKVGGQRHQSRLIPPGV
jgi:hypothetical protein